MEVQTEAGADFPQYPFAGIVVGGLVLRLPVARNADTTVIRLCYKHNSGGRTCNKLHAVLCTGYHNLTSSNTVSVETYYRMYINTQC